MTQTPQADPDPKDADLGDDVRHEVEQAAGDDGTGAEERDDPAFEKDDGAMDAPPPG